MIDDDTEVEEGRRGRRGRALPFVLTAIGLLALCLSGALLLTGRSLLWRGVGLVLASLVAPLAVTISVRLRAQANPDRETPRGLPVVVFVNLASVVIAFAHALYVTRRFL